MFLKTRCRLTLKLLVSSMADLKIIMSRKAGSCLHFVVVVHMLYLVPLERPHLDCISVP